MSLEAANQVLDDTVNRLLTVEFAPPPSTTALGNLVGLDQMYQRIDGLTSAVDLTRIMNG